MCLWVSRGRDTMCEGAREGGQHLLFTGSPVSSDELGGVTPSRMSSVEWDGGSSSVIPQKPPSQLAGMHAAACGFSPELCSHSSQSAQSRYRRKQWRDDFADTKPLLLGNQRPSACSLHGPKFNTQKGKARNQIPSKSELVILGRFLLGK